MNLFNIDIVNKKVANDTKISEKDVTIINKFYWDSIADHVRGLNLQPINLMGIGLIKHSQILIRKKILKTITKLRRLRVSKKYTPDSIKKNYMEQYYINQIQELLKIRNVKTFEVNE